MLTRMSFKQLKNSVRQLWQERPLLATALLLGIGLLLGLMLAGGGETRDAQHVHQHGARADSAGKPIPAGEADGATYTCSMHPDVKRDQPGQCPVCGMDLVRKAKLSSESGDDAPAGSFRMTKHAAQLARVQTTRVQRSSSAGQLRLYGKIAVHAERRFRETAEVAGRIERLEVAYAGQRVRKGQKIAELYAPALITAQQELQQAHKLADSQPALLAAARRKLRHWQLPPRTIRRLATSDSILTQIPLYAQHTGTITQLNVEAGGHLKQGEALYRGANLGRVWAVLEAYEQDLPHLEVGQPVRLTTEALPRQSFRGTIDFVAPTLREDRRTAEVRTTLANPNGALKPGMLLQARVTTKPATAQQPLTVPASAVLWTGPRSVVYKQVNARGDAPRYQMQEVKLGPRRGEHYVVQAGLEAGQRIVTHGTFMVDAAAQLADQPAMMNRPSSAPAQLGGAAQQQLSTLLDDYLALKDALVASDSVRAGQAAQAMQAKLARFRPEAAALQQRWQHTRPILAQAADQLAGSTRLAPQRAAFRRLSQHLIQFLQALGAPPQTLYVQHCPMANDNKGADWLSDQQAIRNPYFGQQMLRCGSVTATLGSANPQQQEHHQDE
jgi:Cu(I)/Ag(I) efflux system membrane fusion protein